MAENIEEYQLHKIFMKNKKCNLSFIGHEHVNGCEIVENTIYRLDFNKHHLSLKNGIIFSVPCLARRNTVNGLLILDLEEEIIEIINI